MKKTIKEWADEKDLTIFENPDLTKKITEKEFRRLTKGGLVIENKYYAK